MNGNLENQFRPSLGWQFLYRVGLVVIPLLSMFQSGCKNESDATINANQVATKSSEDAAKEALAEAKKQRENAMAIIDRVGGKYQIDESNPALPIVSVSLANTKINDAEMLQLRCLTDVRSLDMYACFEVSDTGLVVLRDMKNLESLMLWGCHKFTDAGFEHLAGLKNMQRLNLGYTGIDTITGSGLKWLKGLKNLRFLGVGSLNRFEPSQLSELSELVDLEELAVDCPRLDDEGLKHVLKFQNLQNLGISYSKVTDDGLQQLSGLKKLKRLSAVASMNITDEGISKLKSKIPNLEVVRN